MERLLTITEAAEVLNVPRTWVRDAVTAGAIKHTRVGRHVRFTEAHLEAIIAAGERTPARAVPLGRRRAG